jgi:anti-sigma B factor antagonist
MEKTQDKNVFIIRLSGKLSTKAEILDFNNQIQKLKVQGVKRIVIDLSELDWMSSSGLGALISCYTTIRNIGGDVYISNLSSKIESILKLTKLDSIFEIYDSTELAIHNFLKISN